MESIFGAVAPSGDAPAPGGAAVQFRAGKMTFENNQLKPDTRKGQVKVLQADDGLTHFQWCDRTTGVPVDDLIIFPGESVFEEVRNRVFILKFEGQSDRNAFFWMQESKADGDAELAKQVNAALNGGQEGGAEEDDEMAAALAASLVGGGAVDAPMEDAPAAPAAAAPAASSGQVGLGDLQSALAGAAGGLGMDPAALAASMAGALSGGAGGPGAGARGPSLADLLTPQSVLPMLQDIDVQGRLAEYLPETHRTPEAVADLLQSPQFHQQLETFSHALQTGQLDLSQFGLNPGAGFSVADFLQQIDQQSQKEADDNEGGGGGAAN